MIMVEIDGGSKRINLWRRERERDMQEGTEIEKGKGEELNNPWLTVRYCESSV